MLSVSGVVFCNTSISLFFTLMILFPLTMCMKFPGSSAVKFFARSFSLSYIFSLFHARIVSVSFMLVSGVTLSCLISSSANFTFVKLLILSSASSDESRVILSGRSLALFS